MTAERSPVTTLKPTLGLRSVVLFGLAYMTPIIVLGILGVIAEASSGASAGAYLLATITMLFTASSYARMSVIHPVAGSVLHVRAPLTGLPRGVLGRVGHPARLSLPASGHLAHRSLVPQ